MIHQRKALAKLSPRQAPPFREARSIRKGRTQAKRRRPRPSLGDLVRCQFPGKAAQVDSPRSNGGSREGYLQRSSSLIASLDTMMQIKMSTTKASGKTHLTQVPPKRTSHFPHTSYHLLTIVGQGFGSKGLDVAAAARQVAKEDLSTAKAKAPSERSAQRKKSVTPTTTPPNPTLIAHPSSRTGTTPPHRGGHPRPITSGL